MGAAKKREAVKGEFDPTPIISMAKVLPLSALRKAGLAQTSRDVYMRRTGHMPIKNDPQFREGFKHGFKESVYRRHPYLRPRAESPFLGSGLKVASYPERETPRERISYRGYQGKPAFSRSEATLAEKRSGSRRKPTSVAYHYYHHYSGEKPSRQEKEDWDAYRKQPKEAIPYIGPPSYVKKTERAFKPFSRSVSTIKRQSRQKWGKSYSPYGGESDEAEKERGDYQIARQRGYDPDHLGDLIYRQEELLEANAELLAELKERDQWIDEEYGPLDEEYGAKAARGEYDPSEEAIRERQERERERIREQGFPGPGMRAGMRQSLDPHIKKGLMTVAEFKKAWADPNKRHVLRKLRKIYDPTTNRVINFYHNLKRADPNKYPVPIDIYGYADKHAGAMLRVVPDVHGLAPVNLSRTLDPNKGGMVEVEPKGFLIEQQVKYPRHQWENEILPLLIEDPTVEVDLEHRRIVARGKDNLARNLFIDSDE
jgi:hypothetical protein